jgi:hypothetical protein
VLRGFNMSQFPQFDNAKLMIASSVRHCRLTIEELPVGQIVVDDFGNIKKIDSSTERTLGFADTCGTPLSALLVDGERKFPTKLSPIHFGDLGVMLFRAVDETVYPARLVCVPGHHPQTFLLSLIFQSES